MNSASKAMKRDMLKAAEGRLARKLPFLSKSARRAQAHKAVDMYVATVRKDVKEGKAYVEADGGGKKRTS